MYIMIIIIFELIEMTLLNSSRTKLSVIFINIFSQSILLNIIFIIDNLGRGIAPSQFSIQFASN